MSAHAQDLMVKGYEESYRWYWTWISGFQTESRGNPFSKSQILNWRGWARTKEQNQRAWQYVFIFLIVKQNICEIWQSKQSWMLNSCTDYQYATAYKVSCSWRNTCSEWKLTSIPIFLRERSSDQRHGCQKRRPALPLHPRSQLLNLKSGHPPHRRCRRLAGRCPSVRQSGGPRHHG